MLLSTFYPYKQSLFQVDANVQGWIHEISIQQSSYILIFTDRIKQLE